MIIGGCLPDASVNAHHFHVMLVGDFVAEICQVYSLQRIDKSEILENNYSIDVSFQLSTKAKVDVQHFNSLGTYHLLSSGLLRICPLLLGVNTFHKSG